MFIPEAITELVGFFQIKQTNVSLGTAATQLCPNDPTRVLVIVTNQSVNAFRVGIQQGTVGANLGFIIPGSTNYEIDFRKFGALCCYQLWAFGNLATVVTVTEVCYKPT